MPRSSSRNSRTRSRSNTRLNCSRSSLFRTARTTAPTSSWLSSAKAFASSHSRVWGKNGALTRAASAANGEVLVFTDADTKLTERTLLHVAAPFADPEVGGVAGERRHGHESNPGRRAAAQGKRLLRRLMSRAGSVTSAEGQIYAVRRELFEPVPDNVPDDFWISTRVASQRRLVYEPEAASYPFAGATVVRHPFERKGANDGAPVPLLLARARSPQPLRARVLLVPTHLPQAAASARLRPLSDSP